MSGRDLIEVATPSSAMENKESSSLAQKIVATDTHYNNVRPLTHQYKLLYLKRRNQLLQDNARHHEDTALRRQYLQMRSQILANRYGPLDRKSLSTKSGSRRGSARQSLRQSMESLTIATGDGSFLATPPRFSTPRSSSLVPTKSTTASKAMAGGDDNLSDHYAFCGMQSLFDRHKGSITVVKFANDDKTKLACASNDGTLSVFLLDPEPPTLFCTLERHRGEVNDFDWSMGNDFIVSASSDSTCKLWNTTTGESLRQIVDSSECRVTCCRFHVHNGNLLLTGNSKGQVKVYNVSTGKLIKGGASKTTGSVLSMTLDTTSGGVWAADSKGSVFYFIVNTATGRLQRLKRVVVASNVPITSISCRTWISREARDPSLLLSCADNTLRLYRIMSNGTVYEKRHFFVPHKTLPIKSAFCPLMSFLQGACVVSGSEDGVVYLFDTESGNEVNTLQGHSCPVLGVAWNYDESALATCDQQGSVILWKRSVNR